MLVAMLGANRRRPDATAVQEWVDEARRALYSVDAYMPEDDPDEEITAGPGWESIAVRVLGNLTDRLHELGDIKGRFRGGRAFISYVREDSALVDRLARHLQFSGVRVWLDRSDLVTAAGQSWAREIDHEITLGAVFIACFSAAWEARGQTFADAEVRLALRRLDDQDEGSGWFLPVDLTPNDVARDRFPESQGLDEIQTVSLHEDWWSGVLQLVDATVEPDANVRSLRAAMLDAPDDASLAKAVRAVWTVGDRRQLVPLMAIHAEQLKLIDNAQPRRLETQASYELVKALGGLGAQERALAEDVLPPLVELLRRNVWNYKILEQLPRLDVPRARWVSEAIRAVGDFGVRNLFREVDPLTAGRDELEAAAEQIHERLRGRGV